LPTSSRPMVQQPRILVLTAPDEPDLPGLEAIAGEACIDYARDEATLTAGLPETDILVVTDFRTEILRRAWPGEHHIGWLHATSAGVDALMFPQLVSDPVQITNARGVFDRGIAEYVAGAVLVFAKDTLGNLRHQRAHQWVHRETELIRGRHALVVGAGSIGCEVGALLRALGLQVTGTARHARKDPVFGWVHPSEVLLDLLPEADFVIVTAPLTEQTRGLFDRRAFDAMQPHARFINVGRGPIVRTEPLIAALREGRIAGAALDVLEEEPLNPASPLWDMPNVMISAHMAGDFIGWRRALGEQFVENFRRYRRGDPLCNTVEK
jgi:phosphoglycerate dehydrogenase-like enzyme